MQLSTVPTPPDLVTAFAGLSPGVPGISPLGEIGGIAALGTGTAAPTLATQPLDFAAVFAGVGIPTDAPAVPVVLASTDTAPEFSPVAPRLRNYFPVAVIGNTTADVSAQPAPAGGNIFPAAKTIPAAKSERAAPANASETTPPVSEEPKSAVGPIAPSAGQPPEKAKADALPVAPEFFSAPDAEPALAGAVPSEKDVSAKPLRRTPGEHRETHSAAQKSTAPLLGDQMAASAIAPVGLPNAQLAPVAETANAPVDRFAPPKESPAARVAFSAPVSVASPANVGAPASAIATTEPIARPPVPFAPRAESAKANAVVEKPALARSNSPARVVGHPLADVRSSISSDARTNLRAPDTSAENEPPEFRPLALPVEAALAAPQNPAASAHVSPAIAPSIPFAAKQDAEVVAASTDAISPSPMSPLNAPQLPTPGDATHSVAATFSLAANFASTKPENFARDFSANNAPIKKIVEAGHKELTGRAAELGTGVAKSADAMPSFTLPHREAPASPLVHVEGAATSAGVTSTLEATPSSFADGTRAAQRAVETVLSLAERFASTDRHAVNLHFSIGGSDLQVRVEMRADEVRTAFRTESAELRDALAHEWQAIDGPAGDRAIRFAEPVFSSAPSAQDATSQQQPQHREPAARPFPLEDARLFRGATGRDTTTSSDAAPARAPDPLLDLTARLHAFA